MLVTMRRIWSTDMTRIARSAEACEAQQPGREAQRAVHDAGLDRRRQPAIHAQPGQIPTTFSSVLQIVSSNNAAPSSKTPLRNWSGMNVSTMVLIATGSTSASNEATALANTTVERSSVQSLNPMTTTSQAVTGRFGKGGMMLSADGCSSAAMAAVTRCTFSPRTWMR